MQSTAATFLAAGLAVALPLAPGRRQSLAALVEETRWNPQCVCLMDHFAAVQAIKLDANDSILPGCLDPYIRETIAGAGRPPMIN